MFLQISTLQMVYWLILHHVGKDSSYVWYPYLKCSKHYKWIQETMHRNWISRTVFEDLKSLHSMKVWSWTATVNKDNSDKSMNCFQVTRVNRGRLFEYYEAQRRGIWKNSTIMRPSKNSYTNTNNFQLNTFDQ